MVTDFKDYEKSLGSRLRGVREQFGLSQLKVAEIFKLTRATWSRYENAARVPGAEFLYTFAEHFKINPLWLISGVGEMMASTVSGGMQCGETLGTYTLPVDDELMEIAKYLRKNEAVRKLVLAMVRGAEKPKK